ncbi:hypothetical protein Vadar_000409 [Vaccinium darrowii]|uniref:Uncharacterized protein n=1 Tax=Vaccinium darrowii TaxID=229202 RepID=A0ACB7XX57_9ERIC|nr:hypothetical protein Vadar_000409 [Vaccinium darrowii]
MAEGTRSQEIKRLDESIRLLKESSDESIRLLRESSERQAQSMAGITDLVATLNSKYEQLNEKPCRSIIPYIIKYGKHPVTGAPLKQVNLITLNFLKNSKGEYHCPVLNKVFTEFTHIVAVKTTGNAFCYEAIKELNIKTKNWKELLTDEPFTRGDPIRIQNPNALDTKVLVDFDHVKNSLKLDDEELEKMKSDPTYNINISGDIKQMLKELGTENGKEIALHGGGGNKAQNERAAALTTILAARSRIKDDSNGEATPKQSYSIVGAASASVHGRSVAAAKSASSDKTAARIAMHMAGLGSKARDFKKRRLGLASSTLNTNSPAYGEKIQNEDLVSSSISVPPPSTNLTLQTSTHSSISSDFGAHSPKSTQNPSPARELQQVFQEEITRVVSEERDLSPKLSVLPEVSTLPGSKDLEVRASTPPILCNARGDPYIEGDPNRGYPLDATLPRIPETYPVHPLPIDTTKTPQ